MQLILASASEGRKKLLSQLKVPFKIVPSILDEEKIIGKTPLETIQLRAKLKGEEVAIKLLSNKAIKQLREEVGKTPSNYSITQLLNYFIISADSGAVLDGKLIGKPKDYRQAKVILNTLSGKTHEFVTAVYALRISKFIPIQSGQKSKPSQAWSKLQLKIQNHEKRKASPKETILESKFNAETSDQVKSGFLAQKIEIQDRRRASEKIVSEEMQRLKKFSMENLSLKIWQDYDRSYVAFRKLSPEDIKLYLSLINYKKYAGGYALYSAQNFIVKIEGSLSNVIGLPLEKIIPILRENGLI